MRDSDVEGVRLEKRKTNCGREIERRGWMFRTTGDEWSSPIHFLPNTKEPENSGPVVTHDLPFSP